MIKSILFKVNFEECSAISLCTAELKKKNNGNIL